MWGHNDTDTEWLRSIPLFADCSAKELAQVDSLVAEDRAVAGEVLIRQGTPGRESFIIVSGEAMVTVGARLLAKLGPGDFFGEMALLGRRNLRTATVTAMTPMRLLVADPRQFNTLLHIEGVARSMLGEVVDRMSNGVSQRPA
jgi:CRP/FNR family transcriptional regulator, cyclic AMP receptor protein